jgi:hypothetical protein
MRAVILSKRTGSFLPSLFTTYMIAFCSQRRRDYEPLRIMQQYMIDLLQQST